MLNFHCIICNMILLKIVMTIVFVTSFSILTLGLDYENQTYGNAIVTEITSVYDGDTFRANVAGFPPLIGQHILIRVAGIDAPEMDDPRPRLRGLALKSKQVTVGALRKAKKVELKNMRRDKYFRILADVYVDGVSLSQLLLKQHLARPYDGGKKSW